MTRPSWRICKLRLDKCQRTAKRLGPVAGLDSSRWNFSWGWYFSPRGIGQPSMLIILNHSTFQIFPNRSSPCSWDANFFSVGAPALQQSPTPHCQDLVPGRDTWASIADIGNVNLVPMDYDRLLSLRIIRIFGGPLSVQNLSEIQATVSAPMAKKCAWPHPTPSFVPRGRHSVKHSSI